MKKLAFGILLLTMISMYSCSRDYYCRCDYTYTGAGHAPNEEELITIKGTKKYAETTCSERNAVFTNDEGDTTTAVCELY